MLKIGLNKVEKKKERQKKKAEAKLNQNGLELVLLNNEDGAESEGSVQDLEITHFQNIEQKKA